jgi:hypothetical protein
LVIADHALGLPVFRALSLCTCRRHYPGAASERTASLHFIQTFQSFTRPNPGWTRLPKRIVLLCYFL